MTNTFFIGDTHFTHRKILVFEKEFRPFDSIEEHDEELIRRWNSVVTKHDTVWHLGDVLFSGHSFPLLDRLNGNKNLVMGNHDTGFPIARWLEKFKKVVGLYQFDGSILTHIPVHPNQFHKYKSNIHGHLHHNVLEDNRYINVSCEQINLTPIAYEELKKRID